MQFSFMDNYCPCFASWLHRVAKQKYRRDTRRSRILMLQVSYYSLRSSQMMSVHLRLLRELHMHVISSTYDVQEYNPKPQQPSIPLASLFLSLPSLRPSHAPRRQRPASVLAWRLCVRALLDAEAASASSVRHPALTQTINRRSEI